MIKTILNSFLLVFLMCISHESKSIDTNYVQYALKFTDFTEQCRIKVNTATLRIETNLLMNDKYIAICVYQDNIIQVNPRAWKRLSVSKREQTIFHELFHCLLNQRHDENGLNIMNSVGFIDINTYIQNYDYFIRRGFKDCNKPYYERFKYMEVK